MRFLYTLLLTLAFSWMLSATDSYKGYLITKDNIQLTGFVNTVSITALGTLLEFTNDFGTTYIIHPALVKGFAFKEGDQTYVFLSRFYKKQWYFLEVKYLGPLLSLYEAPEPDDNWVISLSDGFNNIPAERFWIQKRDGPITPVPKFGFRRKMRKYMGDQLDLMDSDMEKKNFRYRNLLEIVKQINAGYKRGKQRT